MTTAVTTETALTPPLWENRSRIVLGAGWVLGVVVVTIAWWGVSGEATVGQQFRWLALGVVGVIVCVAAGAAWLFAGLRAVGLRIRAVVPQPAEIPTSLRELRIIPDHGDGVAHGLVAAPGMRYYHRRSCPLARGKAVRPAEQADHVREGRAACGVCRPDAPAGVSAA